MISCEDVFKLYINKDAGIEVPALRGVDLEVKKGDFISLLGPSGSGKSTLLKILSGFELPSIGRVIVNDCLISKYSLKQRIDFLRDNIGFLLQQPKDNLFPGLDCLSNLILSSKIVNKEKSIKHDLLAKETLEFLGLEKDQKKKIKHLSGGEAQRLALGTLLVKKPALLLLDEPTGNIDRKNAELLVDYLRTLSNGRGITIVMVTHNSMIAEKSSKIHYINNGHLTSFKYTKQSSFKDKEGIESVIISKEGTMTLPRVVLENLEGRLFSCDVRHDRIILSVLDLRELKSNKSQMIFQVGKQGELTIPVNILQKVKINNGAFINIENGRIVLTRP